MIFKMVRYDGGSNPNSDTREAGGSAMRLVEKMKFHSKIDGHVGKGSVVAAGIEFNGRVGRFTS